MTAAGNVVAPVATRWWLWSLLAPIIALADGVAAALAMHLPWDFGAGTGGLWLVDIALRAGCTLSCAFAIVSIDRKERQSRLSLVAAIPSLLFVGYSLCDFLGYFKLPAA